ncbi:MAG: hypothetical protein ABID45_03760 [Patescibacteria group bacterium]
MKKNKLKQNKKIENKKYLLIIISLLVFIFCGLLTSMVTEIFRGKQFLYILLGGGGAFLVLGIALILLTKKLEVSKANKVFLYMTGFSAPAFLIGTVGHNLLYALGTVITEISVLPYIVSAFEVAFFFLAVPVCPIGFIVGIIGSVVYLIKK